MRGSLTNARRTLLAFLGVVGLAVSAFGQTVGFPVSVSGSITGTTCTTNNTGQAGCIVLSASSFASGGIQVSGTWVATLQFEASIDGTNFQAITATPTNSTTTATSTTSNGVWSASVAGMKFLRVRASAYVSGTAVISLQTALAGGGSGGGGGGASSTVTINDPNTPSQKAAVNASGQLSITCANCSGSGASAVDNAAFTAGTTSGAPAMGFFHSTIDTVTDGSAATLAMDSKRNLFNVIRDAAGNARGVNVTAGNAMTVDGSAVTQPASVADGSLVTLGAKADNKSTATDTTAISAISILKEISFMEQNPASRAVTNAGTFAVQAAQSGNWSVRAQDGAGNALTSNSTTYTAKFGLDANVLGTLGTAFSTPGFIDVKGADGNVFVRQTSAANLLATVNARDGAGNALTTNSSTYTAKFALDQNLLGTLGTAFSTAGKVDVKGADGDVFVRQATASNLNATVVGTGTFATQLTGATNNINNISGTVSLPTGAATSALQGVTDADDASIAAGQTAAVSLGLMQAYDGSVWRRMTFGTAGTASAQVWTVQGVASMTPVQVSQATGTNLHIVCDSGCSSSTAPADEAAFTAGTTPQSPIGGFFQTTATNNALTNGQMGAWQFTANRAGFVNLRNASGTELGVAAAPLQVSLANTAANGTAVTVSGTVTTSPPANASENVAQFGGTNISTGTGASGAGIPRVTVANDSNVLASQSGTWNSRTQDGAGNALTTNSTTYTAKFALDSNLLGSLGTAFTTPGFVDIKGADGNVFVRNATAANLLATVNARDGAGNALTSAARGSERALSVQIVDASGTQVTSFGTNPVTANQGTANTVANAWPILMTNGTYTATVNSDGTQAVRCEGCGGLTVQAKGGLAKPVVGMQLYGSLGQVLGDNIPLKTANVTVDPCQDLSRAGSAAISQAANAVIITGQPGRRIFLCHYTVVGADAENLSWVEGTGSTCGTSTLAVVGGATAANGMNFAANGGVQAGDGASWIAVTAVPGNTLCLFQSGVGRVAGAIKYALY
jgi:hypothetical protein